MKAIQVIFFLLAANYVFAQHDTALQRSKNTAASWLQRYDFNPSSFKNPPLLFGPMARWWWPGNDVTKEELKREINLFADNGFAGVEVQPMNLALPPISDSERKKVISWDTPGYYENLRTVMEEARKRNLIVDMTNGSGWPPAAPNLLPEDGFLSLEFSDTTVSGGKDISFILPSLPASKNRTKAIPQLQAIVIAKTLPATGSETQTVQLNSATLQVITSYASNGSLTYSSVREATCRCAAVLSLFRRRRRNAC